MLGPRTRNRVWAALAALILVAAACSDNGADTTADTAAEPAPADDLYVVVTTTILGDVVSGLVGDAGTVEVLLPVGADPHDFQLSSQDGAKLREADLVVANGLGLEENLESIFDSARQDGVRVLEVGDHVDALAWAELEGGHDDHEDHEEEGDGHDHDDHEDHEEESDGHDHDDHEDHEEESDGHDHDDHEDHEEESDGHDHDDHEDHEEESDGHDHGHAHAHGAFDPHFWFDPSRMEQAVRAITAELIAVGKGRSADEWNQMADSFVALIREAADEATEILEAVPASRRILVTNHDSFQYFGQYFGFKILDTILAGGSTLAQPGTAHLAELVDALAREGVPAIFTETTADSRLPETVAAEFDPPLQVVELYTGSLGPAGSEAETYLKWVVTNARLISEALSG